MTIEIAAGCPGINFYDRSTFKRSVQPVPDEFLDFFVPWPWQERLLPVGAYTSLWPSPRGNDWSKVKPANWSANWRPEGWGDAN
jgi:hypothetical protein